MSEFEKAYRSPETEPASTTGLAGWLCQHRRGWLVLDAICMILWLVLGLAAAVLLDAMARELSPESVLTFRENLFWIGIPAAILVVGICGIIQLLRNRVSGKWLTLVRLITSVCWLLLLLYECYRHIGPDLAVAEFMVTAGFVGFSLAWYWMIWLLASGETVGRRAGRIDNENGAD